MKKLKPTVSWTASGRDLLADGSVVATFQSAKVARAVAFMLAGAHEVTSLFQPENP